MASAGSGSIFAEGDIAHVMGGFDAPVATAQCLQLGASICELGRLLKRISRSWLTCKVLR